MAQMRTYEVQLWGLQDDFITVLKYANLENKGQIQNAKFKTNIDGTENFSFEIPMYFYRGKERIENPIWYNVQDGVIIADLRKIKLIFNKDTDKQKIFELIIVKVSEKHEKDTLICSVECEGLAFHELGKVGYKISLTNDNFINEVNDFCDQNPLADTIEEWQALHEDTRRTVPVANINYWLNQFLMPYPGGTNPQINPKQWYYTIWMNYDSYSSNINLDTTKIYEDGYIGSWAYDPKNDKLTPSAMVDTAEKYRLVDLEESNIYNLTQDLAEKFGVFCRYEFDHDASLHITGRKIIFYNNFYNEADDGFLDITYPYSASSVERTMDGSELTSKLFVRPVNSEDNEQIDILHVDANKSLEDYILNFDYLHDIKTISDEQYESISAYEATMRHYNFLLDKIADMQVAYNVDYPTYKARQQVLENQTKQDVEQLNQSQALLNSITNNTGELYYTNTKPETVLLLQEATSQTQNNNNQTQSNENQEQVTVEDVTVARYYIKLKQKGIKDGTIRIYQTNKFNNTDSQLEDELTGWTVEYDEARNPIALHNIVKIDESKKTNIVYLTYTYSPKLYYERLENYWTKKLARDQAELEEVELLVDKFNSILATLENDYNLLLNTGGELATGWEPGEESSNDSSTQEGTKPYYRGKKREMELFEQLMRPALREGYWQPEDFKDYGDHFFDIIPTSTYTYQKDSQAQDDQNKKIRTITKESQSIKGVTDKLEFIWDTEPFEDEQLSYYRIEKLDSNEGEQPDKEYYPIYNLNHIGTALYDFIKEHPDKLLVSFFQDKLITDYTNQKQRTVFTIGSQLQYGFVRACYATECEAVKPKEDMANWSVEDETGQICSDTDIINTYENAPCLIFTGAQNLNIGTADFIELLKTVRAMPVISELDFYSKWIEDIDENGYEASNISYKYNTAQGDWYFDVDSLTVTYTDPNTQITSTYTNNTYPIKVKYKYDTSIVVDEAMADGSTVEKIKLFFLNGRLSRLPVPGEEGEWIITPVNDGTIPTNSNEAKIMELMSSVYSVQHDVYTAIRTTLADEKAGEYSTNSRNFLYPSPRSKSGIPDNSEPMLRYPRLKISSMKLKNSEDQLIVQMKNVYRDAGYTQVQKLNPIYDYYVFPRSGLTRNPDNNKINLIGASITKKTTLKDLEELINPSAYYITIKPEIFFEAGIQHLDAGQQGYEPGAELQPTKLQSITINYVLSNADLAIYLDALKVSKENAYPKVEYAITPTLYRWEEMVTAYDLLARLLHINDTDLKFNNVSGYVSGVELDLDHPDNDTFEVKNYKTKFEDLFSNIVAQSQEMKKTQVSMDVASSAFTVQGLIDPVVLTDSLSNTGISFTYNGGALTINEDGITATSNEGAVTFKNNGIFTATEKDLNGWKWSAAVTPMGVNAEIITEGQLDISRVKIYAGNELRFQVKEDGIYAYKSLIDDAEYVRGYIAEHGGTESVLYKQWEYLRDQITDSLDPNQYVKFDEQGLTLVAQNNAYVITTNGKKQQYWEKDADNWTISNDSNNTIAIDSGVKYYDKLNVDRPIERVKISWDGLTLRNWDDEKVFYADPDTGDLILSGTVYAAAGEFTGTIHANSGYFGTDKARWVINDNDNYLSYGEIKINNEGQEYIDSESYIGLGASNDSLNIQKNYNFWAGATQPEWSSTTQFVNTSAWESGSLQGTGSSTPPGTEISNNKRLRTINFIDIRYQNSLSVDTTYRFVIQFYDETQTFLQSTGWVYDSTKERQQQVYNLMDYTPACYVRFILAKPPTGNTAFSQTDINNINSPDNDNTNFNVTFNSTTHYAPFSIAKTGAIRLTELYYGDSDFPQPQIIVLSSNDTIPVNLKNTLVYLYTETQQSISSSNNDTSSIYSYTCNEESKEIDKYSVYAYHELNAPAEAITNQVSITNISMTFDLWYDTGETRTSDPVFQFKLYNMQNQTRTKVIDLNLSAREITSQPYVSKGVKTYSVNITGAWSLTSHLVAVGCVCTTPEYYRLQFRSIDLTTNSSGGDTPTPTPTTSYYTISEIKYYP